jgi:hypothetical protein
VQAKAVGSSATGTTASATFATPAAAGDLLLAVVSVPQLSDPAFVTPSGWSKVGGTIVNTGSQGQSTALYYKIAAGGEIGVSVSWTGSLSWALGISEWSSSTGWLAQANVLDTAVTATATGTSATNPSVTAAATTSQTRELLFSFVTSSGTPTLSAPTGGFTLRDTGANGAVFSASGSTTTKADLDGSLDKFTTAAERPATGGVMSNARGWSMIIAGFKQA